jgi:hypothetical protein
MRLRPATMLDAACLCLTLSHQSLALTRDLLSTRLDGLVVAHFTGRFHATYVFPVYGVHNKMTSPLTNFNIFYSDSLSPY